MVKSCCAWLNCALRSEINAYGVGEITMLRMVDEIKPPSEMKGGFEIRTVLSVGATLYSHSMDAGGLVLISNSTRLIPFTSLRMRLEASRSRS